MTKFEVVTVGTDSTDLHSGIQIALANVPVSATDIECSYLGKPNLSRTRLKPFTNLLNEVSSYRSKDKSRIDLVVFPRGERASCVGVDVGGVGATTSDRRGVRP